MNRHVNELRLSWALDAGRRSVDGPFVTRSTTKPHQDIIFFIILAISFSISLYNLSQKGNLQINVFEWSPVNLGFRLKPCIADIWTTKSWYWKSWKCWFRNKYENNKTGLYWKFKVYARFVATILARLNPKYYGR